MWKPASPYNNLPELPPQLRETAKIFRQTTQSRVALERLHQTMRLLPENEIIAQIIPVLEAQSSSEIENIVTTTDNLMQTRRQMMPPKRCCGIGRHFGKEWTV